MGLAILDLQVLREMGVVSDDGPDSTTSEIIALFLREERPRVAQLPSLLQGRRGDDLARAAHKVVGSCAILGARQAQAAAGALELAAKAEAWTEAAARLGELQEAWTRLESALAEYRKTPRT